MGNCNSCCHEDTPAVPVEVTAWNRDQESEVRVSSEEGRYEPSTVEADVILNSLP